MRSLGNDVQSATTQVKVLSPEILHIAQGQGFHFLEASKVLHANGERNINVPGSKSVAGERTVYAGTWENRNIPFRSCQGAEKVTRQYAVPVVGLTHNRGNGRVMPVEWLNLLEGVSGSMQRDDDCYALH